MKLYCESFAFDNERYKIGDIFEGLHIDTIFRDKRIIYFESSGKTYKVNDFIKKDEWIDLDNNDYFYTFNSSIPFLSGVYARRDGKKHNFQYRKAFMTFDIETTTWEKPDLKDPFATMYHWQTCVCGKCFHGRTWEEMWTHFENIRKLYKLSSKNVLVCYVHNLSFEFQFIHNFFNIITEKSWCNAKDKPVKILTEEGFEFRCSYILSNMNLKKFCENTKNVLHGKLSGDLNYKIKRHHLTALTIQELRYCFNDVMGLYEAINQRLHEEENGLISIPLTSTGYVRRELKNKISGNWLYKQKVERLCPSINEFDILVKMFRGGNTHANRFFSTKFLENVGSVDIASSYPFQIMSQKYPASAFQKVREDLLADYDFIEFCRKERCCIFKVIISDFKVKENCTIPYLSVSKCLKISNKNYSVDNGRILSSDLLELYCNELDLEIIESQLEDIAGISIEEMYTAKKDYLPLEIRELCLEFFEKKTQLKDIDGKEYEYAKSKNLLNAIYGMMVTNCIKEITKLSQNGYFLETLSNEEREKRLKKEYKKGFLAFQWGVWITSYARRELQEMIDLIGEDVVYCDTDSVKFLNVEKHIKDIKKYNSILIEKIEELEMQPFAIRDNKKFYMGIFEIEKTAAFFKTFGAKKYISIYRKSEHRYTSKITVAGCSKKHGTEYIESLAKSYVLNKIKNVSRETLNKKTFHVKHCKSRYFYSKIEAKMIDRFFKIGLVIPSEKSGRNVAYRAGSVGKQELTDYLGNSTEEITTSSLAMLETTYQLGLSDDYEKLLSDLEIYLWG